MSTLASSPFEAVAIAVKAVFDATFATEQFVMVFDDLHESLGREYVAVGISPTEDITRAANALVQETWVEVKFYDLYPQEIDPNTGVDPTTITGYAERFRNALRGASASDPGTGQVWYFDVRRITYPRDPTGNKTRFVATIRAFGNNSNLVETVA